MPTQPRPSKLLNQIDAARKFLAIKEAKKRGQSVLFLNKLNKKYIANPNGTIDILPLNDYKFKIYLMKNNLTHILQEISTDVEEI